MNILIIGGSGLIGFKLAQSLANRGHLMGRDITAITCADLAAPPFPPAAPITTRHCDITDPASLATCITEQTDVIYLLAAALSSHCEAEFETGLNINMMGVLNVLERCRALGTAPTVVFSSSIAAYGGEVPIRSPMPPSSIRKPLTARKRPSERRCSTIIPAVVLSMAAASDCPQSRSVRASRTSPPPPSCPRSSASLSPVSPPIARWIRTSRIITYPPVNAWKIS
ncbi:NAD-dependent epimerase/dehydratase family protein [Rhodobacteraceae bacterium D3-12]|nr:NAD-dependent epimerase/dehydratase family protein [Rhodobacteraceae bacterium D3-12]